MDYKQRKTDCATKDCRNPHRPRQRTCKKCHAIYMRVQRMLRVTTKAKEFDPRVYEVLAEFEVCESCGAAVGDPCTGLNEERLERPHIARIQQARRKDQAVIERQRGAA